MILFEQLVTAGQLLANNMRPENDLFLKSKSKSFYWTVSVCVSELCLPSNDQTQSEHVPALTEVN